MALEFVIHFRTFCINRIYHLQQFFGILFFGIRHSASTHANVVRHLTGLCIKMVLLLL